MRMKIFLQGLILSALLLACGAQAEEIIPIETPTIRPTQSNTPAPSPTSSPSPVASPTPIPVSAICTPLEGHDLSRITEYISHAYREPEGSNLETGHHGVDFSYYAKDGSGPPIDGTAVLSMFDGRVAGIGVNRLPYGNMVVIETKFEELPTWVTQHFELEAGNSLYLLYAHMLEFPSQSIGEQVQCGDSLGQVGNSGFSGNPHLHLETRVAVSALNLPTMIFYETTATIEEQAAYIEWRSGDTFKKHDPTSFLIQAGAQK